MDSRQHSYSVLLGFNFAYHIEERRSNTKKVAANQIKSAMQPPQLQYRRGGGTSLSAYTQPTIILGTAAIVGISIVCVRWLSSTNPSEEERIKANRRKYAWMPWWWPIIAMQRWNKQKKNTTSATTENQFEHKGSCQCGSITFVIRGPKHLHALHSLPGKNMHYPKYIPTFANNFQLIRGEQHMRFYYEGDTTTTTVNDNDDNSSVTFEEQQQNSGDDHTTTSNQAQKAQVFCGNCGVHLFHANRESGELEVNANCLDDEGGEVRKLDYIEQLSSISDSFDQQQQQQMGQLPKPSIETLLENEPFLGSTASIDAMHQAATMLADNTTTTGSSSTSMNYNTSSIPRKESISSSVGSPTTTQPESYSVAEESDDLSMGSMSSLPLYHSALSVASGATGASTTNYRTTTGSSSSYRTGLRPPLPPTSNNRNPSSDRSVKTLPPWLGDRPPGTSYTASGGRSRGGWSVASLESNDLDGGDNDGKTTVSPRMRDQMKKYLERHTRSST